MRRAELAKLLISAAGARERRTLIVQHLRIADEKLADEIRTICYSTWTSEPIKARRAAAAMRSLAKVNNRPSIQAATFWVEGIANLTKGKFEAAVFSLDNADEILTKLQLRNAAAQTKVAKLIALALLGKYDDAVTTGTEALAVFKKSGDELAAGKVEKNLGNIVARQGKEHEAIRYYLLARRRFLKINDISELVMCDNSLANSFLELNDFRKAEAYFVNALKSCKNAKMHVTEAEIEASLGNLALMRGDYRAALHSLEVSRQRYSDLEMPHQSAIAMLEIADIYAELNLVAEATDIYNRVAVTFSRLKLRAEEARARLNLGRLLLKTRDLSWAKRSLIKSRNLFEREKNLVGTAVSTLSLAEAEIELGNNSAALQLLNSASKLVNVAENPRGVVRLEMLIGIEKLTSGDGARSKEHFERAIGLAKKQNHPEAIRQAELWLGRAYLNSDPKRAIHHFNKAIDIVERHRGHLAAEEFNMSYSATRLDAYTDLGKLLLSQNRIGKAFEVFEMGRSRSLLGRKANKNHHGRASSKLIAQAANARAELNLLYRRADTSTPDETPRLRSQIANAERSLANIDRQINSLTANVQSKNVNREDFTLSALQSALGGSTSLIEYVVLDGEIGAFVVTNDHIAYVPSLASEHEIGDLLENLNFQLDTLRYGSGHLARFVVQLKAKTDRVLAELCDKLFTPVEKYIQGERLLVVPAGKVNYAPFSALFDRSKYLVEKFEIRQAPSAAIWQQLAKRRRRKFHKALLVGFADERIPQVENEIKLISKVWPDATRLNGKSATFSAFSTNAADHDLLHIACHGQFRPDNPMFSSLHLADGWVTVRDLVANKISAELVTLSACETGTSEIFAGEEILGLARGFLSAGARSMIVSLWAVNDTAATEMMPRFYQQIIAGVSPATALRDVQLDMIAREAHPSLWAPFFYIGP